MAKTQQHKRRLRGRPPKSSDEVEAMKRQIAQTAQRLFQEEGYGKVSMRRLATEIGCSPMTLYKYYDGKIAILQTLWSVVFAEVFDQIEAALKDATDPRQRLNIACRTYVQYWIKQPEHYRLVFMAEGVTQPEVSMFIDNSEVEAGFGRLAETILAATSSSSDQMAKTKIDLTISALHGIAHNVITISGYNWSGVDDMIEHYVERIT